MYLRSSTHSILLILFLTAVSYKVNAQTSPSIPTDSIVLEEWKKLNVTLYSSSKKEEQLFNSPYSAYVLSSEEIQRSGATTIPEALHLVPGLIVRQLTNGIYDIHILGFDNILDEFGDHARSNSTTLIMVDNRPIPAPVIDGAFMEGLAIDLIDVERIEVIRGPAGVKFGPNAASGVINIVTQKHSGSSTQAHVQTIFGTAGTIMGGAMLSKQLTEKFDIRVSGNYQYRQRFQFDYANDEGFRGPPSSISMFPNSAYPNPQLALLKRGLNVSVNYAPQPKMEIRLNTGVQDTEVQRHTVSYPTRTAFTTNQFTSYYANLDAKFHGLSARGSVQTGSDDLNRASPPNQYDYTFLEGVTEYDFSFFNEKLHIIPGLGYQAMNVSDEQYVDGRPGFFNGTDRSVSTTSAFVRSDATPIDHLRLVAAIRADKFSAPDDVYLSYEFAAAYTIAKNYQLHVSATRGTSSPSVITNYLDITRVEGANNDRYYLGDPTLKLFTLSRIDVGFRARIDQVLHADIEFFQQKGEGFTELMQTGDEWKFVDRKTTATQKGVTALLNFGDKKFVFRPYVTYQETTIYNHPDYSRTFSDNNTPSIFGGFIADVQASRKLAINVNAYQFKEHDFVDYPKKFILNATAQYKVTPQWTLFVSGRNILNFDKNRVETIQYVSSLRADRINPQYVAGLSFKL